MMTFSNFCVWWKAQWATTFGMSRISRPGEGSNTYDTVVMQPATSTTAEVAIQLTRAEQFGDVRIPPPEAPAPYMTMGAGGLVWSGGTPQRPTDGKSGDRGLYCTQAKTRVHLYGANSATPGRVIVDSATDATTPESVIVNGGTAKVARVGDRARLILRATATPPVMGVTTLTISWMDGVQENVIAQFAFLGTSTVPPPGPPVDSEILIPIIEGAEHFLG